MPYQSQQVFEINEYDNTLNLTITNNGSGDITIKNIYQFKKYVWNCLDFCCEKGPDQYSDEVRSIPKVANGIRGCILGKLNPNMFDAQQTLSKLDVFDFIKDLAECGAIHGCNVKLVDNFAIYIMPNMAEPIESPEKKIKRLEEQIEEITRDGLERIAVLEKRTEELTQQNEDLKKMLHYISDEE